METLFFCVDGNECTCLITVDNDFLTFDVAIDVVVLVAVSVLLCAHNCVHTLLTTI